jgi:predicted DNA-binding protein
MAKKPAKKIVGKDADQYMLRLPTGLRDRVARRATENGRSMNTEIIEAIEKHLEGADRISQIWETLKKHQQDIEDIGLIRQAVLNLEGAMEEVGEDSVFYGVLRRSAAEKRRADRIAKLPPITVEQAEHIRALIKETNTPEDKLLKVLKASSIEEIKDYDRVVRILEGQKNPPA